MSSEGASYRAAGVDYETLDAGKRLALSCALATSPLLAARGGRALDASRGEPAFAFELGGRTLAFVVEGLGTKAMIARAVLEAGGENRFADVAYDTVAAIANDLCCVGALPLVINAYFATGSSEWYANAERSRALVEGWQRACADAGATWGGGESPSLPGLLEPDEIELAGAAVGAVPEGGAAILGERLAAGDEIVLVASSGLHANGASLARLIAGKLPYGYATPLPDGESFGSALLAPSVMYVPLVAALLEQGVPVSYLSHVTGHGLLKLMRPQRELTYRIRELPPVPPVLAFLVEQAGLDAAEAHKTFNMGSGFAVYCANGSGRRVVELASGLGLQAIVAGCVEEGPRRVVVEPVSVTYEGDEMELSAEKSNSQVEG
ncbi:MAG TPA: AIR synthase-related protein [Solirubrobacteraceae bacterium]|nr:AIR synthase-related protein [Solirubrobacteraceae bacterium]